MTIVLHEGGVEDVQSFFDAFDSLIMCMDCGGIDKGLIKADLWCRLINSRPCKSWRYEAKVPYMITRDSMTFTASIVIVAENCILAFENALRVNIRHTPIFIKMTLENIQPTQKVLNVGSGWLHQRFSEFIQAVNAEF
jgi:hypothetical protein